jgi:two-component system, sensor histidine kinase PdtaS
MDAETQLEPDLSLAAAVIGSSTSPLVLLDGRLNVVTASASFLQAFHLPAAGTLRRNILELGSGEWNVPQLRSLLNATLAGDAEIDSYEIDLQDERRGARRLVLNAHRLEYEDTLHPRILLAVSDVTEARTSERLKDDLLREKAILLQEVRHRVANSLQIIASVLLQSARKVLSEETRGHLHDAHQRVMSVAALQQQLASSELGEVELRGYLVKLCDSIAASMIHDPSRLSLEVDARPVAIDSRASISLGLIVTELVINALKHAFPEGQGGRILVSYHADGPNWTLSVTDDGVGFPGDPESVTRGLGSSIVEALARQLGGEVQITSGGRGAVVRVVRAAGTSDAPDAGKGVLTAEHQPPSAG